MGYKVTFENNSIIITQTTEPVRAQGAVGTLTQEGVLKSNHLGASFPAGIGGGGNEQTGPGGGGNEQTGPGGGGNEQTGPGGGGNEQTGPGGGGNEQTGPGGRATRALPFSQGTSFQMETQCESEWCWAAVSTSVDHYFQPSSTLTQCEIASQVMLEDCCLKPRLHDEAEMLQDALDAVGRLGATKGRLTFEQLQAEINAKRPVCVRIAWFGGSAHYVALSGYEVLSSGVRTVDVADPFYPDSTEDFDLFPSTYHGGGEWTATFFTKQKQGDSNG
jgi:hypothetical protein